MVIKTKNLEKLLENYLDELQYENITSQTRKNYYQTIKLFIHYLKTNNIEELNNTNIEKILKNYRKYRYNDKKNKFSTINSYIIQIQTFLKTLNIKTKTNLLAKEGKKEPKYLTQNEVNEVIKTIPETNIRDKAIIQTLYRTGLRVSELAKLNKDDLDLKSEETAIIIDIKQGKGNKQRKVFIDQETLQLINKMIYKRTRKNRKDKTEALFTDRSRNRISTQAIQNLVKKYAIATDERLDTGNYYTKKLTPHTLRHSFTIHLLNNSKRPINEVMKLLGHSNIKTTQIYSNLATDDIKKGYESIAW